MRETRRMRGGNNRIYEEVKDVIEVKESGKTNKQTKN